LPHVADAEQRADAELRADANQRADVQQRPGAAAPRGGNGGAQDQGVGAVYDPFHSLAFYEASAQYVEPVWVRELW
jgi:hypothetical protein